MGIMLSSNFTRLINSLVFAFLCFSASAQIKMKYSIGSIGSTGSIAPVFTGPVSILGNQCFVLANGVTVLKESANKFLFNPTCLLLTASSPVPLVAYPNPVRTSVRITTKEKIHNATEPMLYLILQDLSGKTVATQQLDLPALNAGYQWTLPSMASGMYVVRLLEQQSQIGSVNIIKVNN